MATSHCHVDCVKNILVMWVCIFLRDGFKILMQILINFLYSICFLYDCNVDFFFSLALISHIF